MKKRNTDKLQKPGKSGQIFLGRLARRYICGCRLYNTLTLSRNGRNGHLWSKPEKVAETSYRVFPLSQDWVTKFRSCSFMLTKPKTVSFKLNQSGHACTRFGDRVMVAGGINNEDGFLASAIIMDLGSKVEILSFIFKRSVSGSGRNWSYDITSGLRWSCASRWSHLGFRRWRTLNRIGINADRVWW